MDLGDVDLIYYNIIIIIIIVVVVAVAMIIIIIILLYAQQSYAGQSMPAARNQWAEVAFFTQVSISNTLQRILAVPKSVVFCNFSVAISIFSCSILVISSVVIDPRTPTIMGIMTIFFMRHNLLISLFNKSYRCSFSSSFSEILLSPGHATSIIKHFCKLYFIN